MCRCVDVEMGSFDNQVMLGFYPVMESYRKSRVLQGLGGVGICVDRCIVDQVVELWEAGVKTYGSCCGHNKVQGMINVSPDDYEKAIALGFLPYVFPADPARKDTVKTKSLGVQAVAPNGLV